MALGFLVPLITGLALGWIVNYLADVLPVTRRFSQPACLYCEAPFHWQDYLLLRRCRSCGKSRRARAWVVPLLLTVIAIFIWVTPPPKIGFVVGAILLLYFTTVFLIDLEHRLILHPTSIVGALLGLGVGLLRWGWGSTLLGGLAGFAIMFAVYLFGSLFTRWRARRLHAQGQAEDDEEAFGQGDVILGTIIGLMLGWPLIWFGMLLAVLLGGAISLLVMLIRFLSGRFRERAWMVFIPYGPFMIASAFLLIYFPAWMKLLVPS